MTHAVGENSTLLERVQAGAASPDDFQSPPWVASILLPYVPPAWRIWESACGKGNLVRAFKAAGRECFGTDILTGHDFFTHNPAAWDVQITNVPYSVKDRWIARSYQLGKPFALLLPLAALGEQKRMRMYREHGIQVVMPDRRINFETPSGEGAGAWFFTCFLCWRIPLPSQIVFWTPDQEQPGLDFGVAATEGAGEPQARIGRQGTQAGRQTRSAPSRAECDGGALAGVVAEIRA